MPDTAALEPIVRAYLARVDDVNPKERSVVGKINTAALDRFGTVIDPKGVELSNYNANRVVLWEHGQDPLRGAMPVGRNGWIRPAIGPDGPELIAKTHFHDKASGKGDEFTERALRMLPLRRPQRIFRPRHPQGKLQPANRIGNSSPARAG